VSGTTAYTADGTIAYEDFEAQMCQVMENITAVLECVAEAGAVGR
jgi:enamine deaminase RidA (YjgF/YER057c/UK114 family)